MPPAAANNSLGPGTRRGSRIRTKNTKYDTAEYETDPEGSSPDDESLTQQYESLPPPLDAEVQPHIAVKEEAKFAVKDEVKPVIKDEAKIDVKDEAKFAVKNEGMVVSNGEESESEDDVAPTTDQNGDPLSERITTNTAMREYGCTSSPSHHQSPCINCPTKQTQELQDFKTLI